MELNRFFIYLFLLRNKVFVHTFCLAMDGSSEGPPICTMGSDSSLSQKFPWSSTNVALIEKGSHIYNTCNHWYKRHQDYRTIWLSALLAQYETHWSGNKSLVKHTLYFWILLLVSYEMASSWKFDSSILPKFDRSLNTSWSKRKLNFGGFTVKFEICITSHNFSL